MTAIARIRLFALICFVFRLKPPSRRSTFSPLITRVFISWHFHSPSVRDVGPARTHTLIGVKRGAPLFLIAAQQRSGTFYARMVCFPYRDSAAAAASASLRSE